MTRADAFLQEILAHPDDDAPRLIFADWLEEQGDASSIARAEFIRVQCALAGGHLLLQRRNKLERRQQEILDEYGNEWARPIRRVVRSWNYHRGFIGEVAMLAHAFLQHAARLFRRVPIQHLRLEMYPWPREWTSFMQPISMASLADSKHLRRLRSLDLTENRLTSEAVRALVVSEHLTSLTALNLSHNRIGDGGIRALADSPLLGRLERLNLCGNDLRANGLRFLARALEALADSPEELRLQRLELSRHNFTSAGQRVIADSPLLRRLVRWLL